MPDFSYLTNIENIINSSFDNTENSSSNEQNEQNNGSSNDIFLNISSTNSDNIAYGINNDSSSSEKIKCDVNNVQIFAEITEYSYYPVNFCINENNKIKIDKKEEYLNLNFHVGSKYQFLYHRYTITNDTNQLNLNKDFKTAWDQSKFLVFLNGYLLNNNLLIFIIPNFDNVYKYKKIFSTISFKKDDILDIYYIESDDNYNKVQVSTNSTLNQIKYTANINNQTIIKVPYPSNITNYTGNEFYIFNDKGKYLNRHKDYFLSDDKKYIILSDENKLEKAGKSHVIITFSNSFNTLNTINNNSLYSIGNISTINMEKLKITSVDIPNKILNLALSNGESFNEYILTNSDFLIFDTNSGLWINNNYFKVLNNSQIKLISDKISIFTNTQYNIYVFKETDTNKIKTNPLICKVIESGIYELQQKKFNIPPVDGVYAPFSLSYNNVFLNNDEELFTIDDTNHILTFIDPSKSPTDIDDGNMLYFIYLYSSIHSDFNIQISKIEFSHLINNTSITIPEKYNNIPLSINNCLLFINNLQISTDYYEIQTSGKIKSIVFKPEYKNLFIINQNNTNDTGPQYNNYTILYLREFPKISNISEQQLNFQDTNNIQFEEIATTPKIYSK